MENRMTPEIAKLALQFMLRVRLEGQEVPAFNAVMASLTAATKVEEKPPVTEFTGPRKVAEAT
jgi:hypothetical protein